MPRLKCPTDGAILFSLMGLGRSLSKSSKTERFGEDRYFLYLNSRRLWPHSSVWVCVILYCIVFHDVAYATWNCSVCRIFMLNLMEPAEGICTSTLWQCSDIGYWNRTEGLDHSCECSVLLIFPASSLFYVDVSITFFSYAWLDRWTHAPVHTIQ